MRILFVFDGKEVELMVVFDVIHDDFGWVEFLLGGGMGLSLGFDCIFLRKGREGKSEQKESENSYQCGFKALYGHEIP